MDPEASMPRFGVVILPYYCVITSAMCNPTLPGRATARNQRRTQGRLALPSEVARRASCRAETSALAGYGHFFACSRSAAQGPLSCQGAQLRSLSSMEALSDMKCAWDIEV
jgi:hypothetical protein